MSTAQVEGARPGWKSWLSRALPWIAVGMLAYVVLQEAVGRPALDTGRPAPALTLTLSTGEAFDLASARGKPVVLNFWGTYCEPCRAEAPELARAYEAIKASGARLIGVSVDRAELAQVLPVAQRLGMTYPIAMGSREALERFKVERVPTTYVIGPSGMIREAIVGTVDEESLVASVRNAR